MSKKEKKDEILKGEDGKRIDKEQVKYLWIAKRLGGKRGLNQEIAKTTGYSIHTINSWSSQGAWEEDYQRFFKNQIEEKIDETLGDVALEAIEETAIKTVSGITNFLDFAYSEDVMKVAMAGENVIGKIGAQEPVGINDKGEFIYDPVIKDVMRVDVLKYFSEFPHKASEALRDIVALPQEVKMQEESRKLETELVRQNLKERQLKSKMQELLIEIKKLELEKIKGMSKGEEVDIEKIDEDIKVFGQIFEDMKKELKDFE